MKRLGIFVAMVLIVAMLFASGCAEEAPEEVPEEVPEENVEGGVEEEVVVEEEIVVEEEVPEEMGEEIVVEEEVPEETGEIKGMDGEYSPVINPEDFVEEIDNPYFPLTPGTTFVYEGESEEENKTLRSEVNVTNETKVIMGINTTVVRETEYEDDELEEETFDWYAQDKDGNVWYFGEDSKEYDEDEVVNTTGSWEAGVDGAQPGIIMSGDPQVGDVYYQEYLEGEAEDQAEVVSLNESVTVAYGSFENCLMTREWNPLEPDSEENKYYAPGVGLLLEEEVEGGAERLELVEIINE